MSYAGGGTTTAGTNPGDPDGWVICDGQTRTVTDSRFINLYPILNTYLGVSSNTANSITPPNLTGRFLYGPSSASTATLQTGGASSVTLSADQIPPLPSAPTSTTDVTTRGIKITDPGHGHTLVGGPIGSGSLPVVMYQNANSAQGGLTGIWSNNTGVTAIYQNPSQTSVSILPPYTTMNYIMKY
jgi:microcystin-dependent protein